MEVRAEPIFKLTEEMKGKNAPVNFPGILKDGEEWMVCPYDKSHRVLKLHFEHLVKCREAHKEKKAKNNEEMDMGICPYNWKHHVPLAELEKHVETCDDQYIIFTYLQMQSNRMAADKFLSTIQYDDDNEWGWGSQATTSSSMTATNPSCNRNRSPPHGRCEPSTFKKNRKSYDPEYEYGMRSFDPSVYQTAARPSMMESPTTSNHGSSVSGLFGNMSVSTSSYSDLFIDSKDDIDSRPRPALGRGRGRGRGIISDPDSK